MARDIVANLMEQSPKARTMKFKPVLTSVDAYLLLEKAYIFTTLVDGTLSFSLPTKTTGGIRFNYEIEKDGGYSTGYFILFPGAEIELSTLMAVGEPPASSHSISLTDPTDGQVLTVRDGLVLNVSETYRRLDTEFGVVADDTVDNSTAIQTALNAIRDSNGGTIVFPNGITKMIGQTVTDFDNNRGSIRILGDGGQSIIRVGNGHANQATGISALYLEGAANAVVEGLTFFGTGGVAEEDFARSVIFFAGVERAIVRDCHFINLAHYATPDATFAANKGHGIVVGYYSNMVIEGCLFEGNQMHDCPSVESYEWRSLVIRDTEFIDLGKLGNVLYNKSSFGNTYWIRAILPRPLATSGWHRNKVRLQDVTFDENFRTGLFVDDADWVEIDNLGVNNGVDGEGIYLKNVRCARIKDVLAIKANFPYTQSAKFEACDFVDIDGYRHANGSLTIETTSATKRIKLRNCEDVALVNTANSFVDSDQGLPATQASAGAFAPRGKKVHVTGSTAITSITLTNLKDGDEGMLIFDSTAQITEGNNIISEGDFTGGANRVWKYVVDGSNVIEVSRKAN